MTRKYKYQVSVSTIYEIEIEADNEQEANVILETRVANLDLNKYDEMYLEDTFLWEVG